MTAVDLVVAVPIVLGCLALLALPVVGAATLRAVRQLARLAPAPRSPARLSVIVPACNEADTIEDAAATLLADDDPDLEIVLVDDRSTDGTDVAVDRLAAADRRVRALHVSSLPDGWMGKTHALHRGVAAATGSWLLFTDADVHFAPGALRRAVSHAEAEGIDHLVVLPDLESGSFVLDVALAAFARQFTIGQRLWAVSDPDSDAFVGVGAFNLVRRSALDRSPGLPWLAYEVADDLALGHLLKRSGARCAVAGGRGLVSLTWYRSYGELCAGMEKNTFPLFRCRPWPMVAAAATVAFVDASPVLALTLPLDVPGLAALGVLASAAGVGSGVATAAWAHRRWLPAALFPLGGLLMAWVLVRAAWLGWRRGGIVWRGTFHPSARLRRDVKVVFPRPRRDADTKGAG